MAEQAAPVEADRAALASVTVLELGERVGASVCGSLLSQLGATVICVEHVDAGLGTKWHNIVAERILGSPPEPRVDEAAPFKR